MDRISGLLEELDWELSPNVTVSLDGSTITAHHAGGRKQKVRVRVDSDRYLLVSTVLGPVRASRLSPQDLARLVFNANQNTDVVAFMVDRLGRFVGRIEQPRATLDREELRTYLLLLARECDRLEFLLTGRDIA